MMLVVIALVLSIALTAVIVSIVYMMKNRLDDTDNDDRETAFNRVLDTTDPTILDNRLWWFEAKYGALLDEELHSVTQRMKFLSSLTRRQ